MRHERNVDGYIYIYIYGSDTEEAKRKLTSAVEIGIHLSCSKWTRNCEYEKVYKSEREGRLLHTELKAAELIPFILYI